MRTWHNRLGHQNWTHVRQFLKSSNVDFIEEEFTCEEYILVKQHRGSYNSRKVKSKGCGELCFADVCGPMQEKYFGGDRYFLLITDDYSSHLRFVYFMKEKSKGPGAIKSFLMQAEKMDQNMIKRMRTECGLSLSMMS